MNPIESAVLTVCSTPHDFACAGPKAHEALRLGIALGVTLLGLVPFVATPMALRARLGVRRLVCGCP